MNKECETCIKRKTVYCPNSIECMATDDKPYYRNKIMLLEENQELKKQLEDTNEELELVRCDLHNRTSERDGYERKLNECLSQQKEFIKYLEDNYKETQDIWYIKILQKYEEIIGGKE